jgi:hypothetical protein
MPDEFQYDVFLSHSAKDKAVVRPLAERLQADGLNPKAEGRTRKEELELHPSAFCLQPFLHAFGSDCHLVPIPGNCSQVRVAGG